jgi:site-specific recombinase XerD
MANALNEKTKRRYFTILRGAKGYSESTIAAIERALHLFEQSTDFQDFKTFSERQATRFKSWLGERTNRGRKLSTTSQYHHLRHVRAFFAWLSTQPGFRSRINLDAVSFLTLDRRSQKEALAVKPRKFPSLEQVRSLVASITIETEMDRRDQALISFMLLTGMRYTALCSLPVGCLDVENQIVYQDPRQGVRTKNGKAITTLILPFDDTMVTTIRDWVTYLSEVKEFSPTDPLFPRTRVAQAQDGTTFEAKDLAPVFWKGGGSIRNILKARSEAAGLPYFNPHSFRHAHVHIALRCCRTPEEFKALSQNIGHEQVMTTLSSYGTLDDHRISDVLGGIDFTGKKTHDGDIPAADVERFLRKYSSGA